MKQLLFFIAIAMIGVASCKKASPAPPAPLKIFTTYGSFDLRISWVGSYNNSTRTFDLDAATPGFISFRNKAVYRFKGNEAGTHQQAIDFIYTISGSGKTGYLSNPGFIKSQYGTGVFGWTEWNDRSLIAAAHSIVKDPVTGTLLALSDEQFNAISTVENLSSTVNFGDNVSVPLDDANKLGSTASFNIYQDGTVDDSYYFVFIDSEGRRGVFSVSKSADAASIVVKVKMEL